MRDDYRNFLEDLTCDGCDWYEQCAGEIRCEYYESSGMAYSSPEAELEKSYNENQQVYLELMDEFSDGDLLFT